MLKICYMEKTIYIMYTYVTYDFKYVFTYIYIYIYTQYIQREIFLDLLWGSSYHKNVTLSENITS